VAPDGQAEIVFATPSAVKPIPWSQALYQGRVCVHPDNRQSYQGNWSSFKD